VRANLGLNGSVDDGDRIDAALADDWLALLQREKVDFTLAWRRLADVAAGRPEALRALFDGQEALDAWLGRWQARCAGEDAGPNPGEARAARMRRVNPWLIARNHRVEEALEAASDRGDLAPFEQLLEALRFPYDERPELSRFAEPAPEDFMKTFQTFCGT
jgi:uncharacterized protein YdiU (UPF0061 family)